MSNGNGRYVKLYGRVFLYGDIITITGLHIGGAQAALAIGGVDNVVIRDPLTNRPYIPGSSLRGKMRSLWEKLKGVEQNKSIGRDVFIHVCEPDRNESPGDFVARYRECPVCPIYGVPAEAGIPAPTRLIVRDIFMSEKSAEELQTQAQTDQPYTEVKWEAAIDRVTSAATPRQMERVPAGVVFSDMEMVYSVFELEDIDRFPSLLESMQLLEDDYLGGLGSRGSGRIAFRRLNVGVRTGDDYPTKVLYYGKDQGVTVGELLDQRDGLVSWLMSVIFPS